MCKFQEVKLLIMVVLAPVPPLVLNLNPLCGDNEEGVEQSVYNNDCGKFMKMPGKVSDIKMLIHFSSYNCYYYHYYHQQQQQPQHIILSGGYFY